MAVSLKLPICDCRLSISARFAEADQATDLTGKEDLD
jgi:hypothetical protein